MERELYKTLKNQYKAGVFQKKSIWIFSQKFKGKTPFGGKKLALFRAHYDKIFRLRREFSA